MVEIVGADLIGRYNEIMLYLSNGGIVIDNNKRVYMRDDTEIRYIDKNSYAGVSGNVQFYDETLKFYQLKLPIKETHE